MGRILFFHQWLLQWELAEFLFTKPLVFWKIFLCKWMTFQPAPCARFHLPKLQIDLFLLFIFLALLPPHEDQIFACLWIVFRWIRKQLSRVKWDKETNKLLDHLLHIVHQFHFSPFMHSLRKVLNMSERQVSANIQQAKIITQQLALFAQDSELPRRTWPQQDSC